MPVGRRYTMHEGLGMRLPSASGARSVHCDFLGVQRKAVWPNGFLIDEEEVMMDRDN